MRRLIGFLIVASSLFAAQDATITSAFTLFNTSVPGQPITQHCTVEFTLDNWAVPPAAGGMISDGPCGVNLQWIGNAMIQTYWTRGIGGSVLQAPMPGTLGAVRWQIDPASGVQTLDVFNSACTNVYSQTNTVSGSTGSNPNGQSVTGTDGTGVRFAWLRLSSDTFQAGTNCPTTAATGRTFIGHWKFEGNLNDSSGNGYTLSCSGTCGSQPAYTATPTAFATLVVANACSGLCSTSPVYDGQLPQGFSAPVWNVGQTNQIDGSTSFSQADASSSCATYAWSMLAHPGSAPTFSSTSVAAPTLTGIVSSVDAASDYNWHLVCTDAASNTGSASGHIGANSFNPSTHQVTTGNAAADLLLGPMIAWGYNPWGYQDYWHLHAGNIRTGDYAATQNSQGIAYPGWSTTGKPQWETPGQGTVTYYFNGVGNIYYLNTSLGTTISQTGGCSATTSSCTVASVSGIDISSFPTRVVLYQPNTICTSSSSAISSGTQTVTPASMAGIVVGLQLVIDGGAALNCGGTTAAQESVVVASVTGSTFTATFANAHSSAPVSIGTGPYWDEIRIRTHTGGILDYSYDPSPLSRHSFPNGSLILQGKITGTGTKFITDPVSPLAPLGAGLPGLSTYSTGTIALTAGSPTVVLSGGSWTNTIISGIGGSGGAASGTLVPGNFIQVPSATHSSSIFNFIAQNTTGGAYATVPSAGGILGGVIQSAVPAFGFVGQNYSAVSGQVTVTVTDPTGSGAIINPIVSGGQVTGYMVASGGTGYSNPSLTVSTSTITLARPYPSDADTGSFGYLTMPAQRTLVLHYQNKYTDAANDPQGDSMLMFGATGVESDTAAYVNPVGSTFGYGTQYASNHDISIPTGGTLDGSFQQCYMNAGCQYSVTDTTGWVNNSSTGGISFYGEGAASRIGHLRSGLTLFKNAANVIDNYWIHSPWGNPDGNGFPVLFLGAQAIESWVSYLIDPSTLVTISDLRGYANIGVGFVCSQASSSSGACAGKGIVPLGCNANDDTRDTGYGYAQIILASIYDPDTTSTSAPGGISWRAYWQNFLPIMEANDTACENQTGAVNAVGSWANGFLWNASFPVLTMTNGSAVATGTGIPASTCNGVASGTATATSSSNILSSVTVSSGTLPTGSLTTNIFITSTPPRAAPFVQSLVYSGAAPTFTMGGNWQGLNGAVTWVVGQWDGNPSSGNPADMMSIATSENDLLDLQRSWACTRDPSGTFITLNRPWDGNSTDGTHIYRPYVGNLSGYGEQPFMLGIKSYGMNVMANQTVSALASYKTTYLGFTSDATAWIWNSGMDHQLFGTNYGRIYQACEPTNTAPTTGITFTYRAPGCTYGAQLSYLSTEQNSETANAHAIYLQNNPITANLNLGDEFYGSLWGYCPWTTGGVYCSSASTASNAPQSNLSDSSIHGGKWYGFFTGMGRTDIYPVIRQLLTPQRSGTVSSRGSIGPSGVIK